MGIYEVVVEPKILIVTYSTIIHHLLST